MSAPPKSPGAVPEVAPLVSEPETARLLGGLSVRTVQLMIRRGDLEAIKLGERGGRTMVLRRSIDKLIASRLERGSA